MNSDLAECECLSRLPTVVLRRRKCIGISCAEVPKKGRRYQHTGVGEELLDALRVDSDIG